MVRTQHQNVNRTLVIQNDYCTKICGGCCRHYRPVTSVTLLIKVPLSIKRKYDTQVAAPACYFRHTGRGRVVMPPYPASLPPAIPSSDVLVIHDSLPGPLPPGWVDGNNVLDLLGHFGLRGTLQPIENYRPGDLCPISFRYRVEHRRAPGELSAPIYEIPVFRFSGSPITSTIS